MSPGKKSEDDAIRHMLYTEEFTQAQKKSQMRSLFFPLTKFLKR